MSYKRSIPRAMEPGDLQRYKGDIQCHAITLYKTPRGMFEGEKRYTRWRLCIRLVADTYLHSGPQSWPSGPAILIGPSAEGRGV